MKRKCERCPSNNNGWCRTLETNSPEIKKSECWSMIEKPSKQDIIDQIKFIESGLDKLKDMLDRFKENRD